MSATSHRQIHNHPTTPERQDTMISAVSHLPEKPEPAKYHTEYGSWINEGSAPRVTDVVKELVEGQSPISLHDLIGLTGYSEGTVAKALLHLGYLRVNDGTIFGTSTWEKVSDRMPDGLTFRPYRAGTRTAADHTPEPVDAIGRPTTMPPAAGRRGTVDDHTADQPQEPTAAPEPQPVASEDGWLTRDPDGSFTIDQFRVTLDSLGFEMRIQIRPRP